MKVTPIKLTHEEEVMMTKAWQGSAIKWVIAIAIAYSIMAIGTWLMPN